MLGGAVRARSGPGTDGRRGWPPLRPLRQRALGRQPRLAAKIRHQRGRHRDRSVGFLAVFQDRDQTAPDGRSPIRSACGRNPACRRPPDGSARSSAAPGNRRRPRPRRFRGTCPGRAAEPRCHGSCAHRTPCRRCTGRRSDRAGPAVAGPPRRSRRPFVFGKAGLGRGDRHHLDLLELVLAQHPRGVLARRPRLRAETLGMGGHAQGQRRFFDSDSPRPCWSASLPRSGSATSRWWSDSCPRRTSAAGWSRTSPRP